MAPKRVPFQLDAESLFRTFSRAPPQEVFWRSLGPLLAHFRLPFGSPWLPFGSLLAPFGSLLAPFDSLWLTFGTLFEEITRTFINSQTFSWICTIGYKFLWIFMFFATPLLKNVYFRKHPRILLCSGNPFRKKPQNAKGTPTENTSSFVASLQGPGAEHLPLGT